MSEPSDHYLDPNNPHNHTDRSGNHYSNGESRLTPEYEWNGWEKVYRTKKPYRCTAPRPLLGNPLGTSSHSSDIMGGRDELQAMDVDSGDEQITAPPASMNHSNSSGSEDATTSVIGSTTDSYPHRPPLRLTDTIQPGPASPDAAQTLDFTIGQTPQRPISSLEAPPQQRDSERIHQGEDALGQQGNHQCSETRDVHGVPAASAD